MREREYIYIYIYIYMHACERYATYGKIVDKVQMSIRHLVLSTNKMAGMLNVGMDIKRVYKKRKKCSVGKRFDYSWNSPKYTGADMVTSFS